MTIAKQPQTTELKDDKPYCVPTCFYDTSVTFYVSDPSLMEKIEGRIKGFATDIKINGSSISFSTNGDNPVEMFRSNTNDLCEYRNGFKNIDADYITLEEMNRLDTTVTHYGGKNAGKTKDDKSGKAGLTVTGDKKPKKASLTVTGDKKPEKQDN